MSKITPFLWYDNKAHAAAQLYVSIFPNSRIIKTVDYGPTMPGPPGEVISVVFELDGRTLTAFNGGPAFPFNEAISLSVECDTQAEIDRYWERLTADGGKPVKCGWLKDSFGLSWQIVPAILPSLLSDPDRVKAKRAQDAMMSMVKLDIAELKRAHAGA
jgi:predicted 3-demethylubiquinone-9 3-methyltransferase (glyoxalase superfamily)